MSSLNTRTDESAWTSRQKSGVLWGGLGLGSLVISVGAHLYADSIWSGRPSGGGGDAQDARYSAIMTSWVGDGFLVTGLVCLVVGGVYYWSEPSPRVALGSTHMGGSKHMSVTRETYKSVGQAERRERPHREGSLTLNILRPPRASARASREMVGALLGWRLAF